MALGGSKRGCEVVAKLWGLVKEQLFKQSMLENKFLQAQMIMNK